MTLAISIAAAVTVAVTAKLAHILFLSGKTVTNATFFGRFVARTEMARRAFADGWRRQTLRYHLVAYPCILVGMGLVSLLLYWMMPALGNRDTYTDMLRYCLLVFAVGISASLVLILILMLLVYFVVCLIGAWWNPEGEPANGRADAAPPTTPPSPPPTRGPSPDR